MQKTRSDKQGNMKSHFYEGKTIVKSKQGSLQFWTRSKTNSQHRCERFLFLKCIVYPQDVQLKNQSLINR